MSHRALAWLLLFPVTLPMAAQGSNEEKTEPDPVATVSPKDREAAELKLLEAELLEISSGEIEKAMTIYSSIHARAELPGALRARALLCLGRCQRKLGRLDEARRLLEEIVAKHAGETDLVRQARSFLRELESGKPENPDFDWLRELEKNPEIQARVFDLAMQLTKTPDKEEMVSARRQLLALGVIAVPVLEKMVETTRDPGHRLELAVVLCQLGRFEHLPKVLSIPHPPSFGTNLGSSFASFCGAVPAMSSEDRARLLEVVAKVPDDPAIQKEKALLRLWAGDRQALGALAAYEQDFERWSGLPASLLYQLAASPDLAAAIAARLLDPGVRPRQRRRYFEVLRDQQPGLLTAAHLELLLRDAVQPVEQRPDQPVPRKETDDVQEYVKWLDEHDGHAAILRLVADGANAAARASVLRYFNATYMDRNPVHPEVRPVWSKVVRACHIGTLVKLAARNDGAIPELVDFLESGEPLPSIDPGERQLSAAFLDAMRRLLSSPRPAAKVFALEALVSSEPGGTDETLARMLSLGRDDEDLHVREFALYGLVRSLGAHPEWAREVAETFAAELSRRSALEAMPPAYFDGPLGKVERLGLVQRGHIQEAQAPQANRGRRVISTPPRVVRATGLPPGSARTSFQASRQADSLAWIMYAVTNQAPSCLEPLYHQAFDLANTGKDRAFHEWLWLLLTNGAPAPLLCSRLGEVKDRAFLEWILLQSGLQCDSSNKEAGPALEALRKRAINDREMSFDARWQVFTTLGEPWTRLEDPVAFFRGDDPVFAKVCEDEDSHASTRERALWGWVDRTEKATRLAILDAALASSIENARLHAAEHLPLELESSRALFEKAFKDSSQGVRAAAARRLNETTRVDVAPLFHQLLGDPEPGVRLECVSALARIASQDSLEPLGKLLDDPDTRVREKTFEALKTIRQRLDEKGEWKKILGSLKTKE